jgi:Amt family ammonium transporter
VDVVGRSRRAEQAAVATGLVISAVQPRPVDGEDPAALVDALSGLAVEAATSPDRGFEGYLRKLVRHLPLTVFSLDADGIITGSYGGALHRLGVADDELVGLDAALLGPAVVESFHQVMAGELTSVDIEGESNGERWVFHIVIAPLPDATGAVAVSFDRTDQVRAEELAAHQQQLHADAVGALSDSEQRFRILAEYAPIGIFIADTDLHLLYLNPAGEEMLGRSLDDELAATWFDQIHPDDRVEVIGAFVHQASVADFVRECRIVRVDGSVRWVRLRSADVRDVDGVPGGYVGTAADITDTVRAEEALREREQRLRAILETAAEGIVTADESGTIVEFNAAAERIFGFDSDEVIGRLSAGELLAEDGRDTLVGGFFEHVAASEPPGVLTVTPIEVDGRTKTGDVVPLELALAEVDTVNGRLFTAVIRDVSERKAFERELEHLATHDSLTGLPNRALMLAQLESCLVRSRRHGTSVAVLFVEIDRVKVVSEALGHRAGDELLIQAAGRIASVVGGSATLSRFAGHQFVVHVEELDDISDAVEIAVAIIEAVNEPFAVAGDDAFVDATVGIAFAAAGAGGAEALVSNADVANARAKESSATRYEVFDTEMRAWVDSRRKLEVALRHGIDGEELELHYQPVIDLVDGRLVGLEALVRWNHPRLGRLAPGEFIPLAEDSGLVVPLGRWIVEEACRQLAEWQQRMPGLGLSVNLSGRQLAESGFADEVAEALAVAGADATGLSFEITETVLLHDLEGAARTLHDLKSLGARIALDDFGTGYSSLTNLVRLPIDVVKVDRSFVEDLATDGPGTTIVSSVVSLATTLELDVVAEGVETEVQRRALVELGCTYAQGFLFARPVPAVDLDEVLSAGVIAVSVP